MKFDVSSRCRNSGVFTIQAPIDFVYAVMDRADEARPAEPVPRQNPSNFVTPPIARGGASQ
jgi:hypothetical protein